MSATTAGLVAAVWIPSTCIHAQTLPEANYRQNNRLRSSAQSRRYPARSPQSTAALRTGTVRRSARRQSDLGSAVGRFDLGNRGRGRDSRNRITSRRLVQINASQTSGGDGDGGSSSGGGGKGDDDAMSLAAEAGGMDWRTFRAKLVAGHEATRSVSAPSPAQEAVGLEIWQDRMSLENWALLASQNPRLAKEVPWVHSTGGAEAGGVLLAAPFSQLPGQGGAEGGDGGRGGGAGALDRRLWQAAVFLVEHGGASGASWGLLLNRPSGYTIQMALAKVNRVEEASLAVFARNAIYIGGFKSDGSTLYFLHGHDLPGAKELMPGVYMGGLEAAAEQVLLGNMPPSDFRFFVGQVEWPAGKLQEEVDAGLWYTAACARSLVLKQCLQLPKPLWQEMLELMGGEYAETARKEYGQSI